jgi:hypothetical protein
VETGSRPLSQFGGPPGPENCGQVAKHAGQAAGRHHPDAVHDQLAPGASDEQPGVVLPASWSDSNLNLAGAAAAATLAFHHGA